MNFKIIKSRLFLLSLLSGILLFFVMLVITYSGRNQLVLLCKSQKASTCQFFWNGSNQEYSGSESVKFTLKPEVYQTLRVNLPENVSAIQSIIFKTGIVEGGCEIDYLLFHKRGFKPVTIGFERFKPAKGITWVSNSYVMLFYAGTGDSSFTIDLPVLNAHIDWILIMVYASLSFLIALLVYYCAHFFRNRKYDFTTLFLVACLAFVIGLSLIMALKAGFCASPDERDHFMAAEYFKTHSLTPVKNSNEAAYTYNALWAYSRVYQQGIEYLLAGKFSSIFDFLIDSFLSVRLFGVFVLAFFIFLAVRFPGKNVLLWPLLVTPQLWYVFSYVNDDFFPLFLSFLLVLITEAGKKELLAPRFTPKRLLIMLLLGTLFGVVVVSKTNFLVFVLFYLFYLLVLPVTFSDNLVTDVRNYIQSLKRYIKTPLLIIAIALMVIGARQLTLGVPAGKEVSKELAAYYEQSQVAREAFIATGISGEAMFGSYPKMLKKWIPASYESFNGVYGFMKYYSTLNYNNLLLFIHFALVLSLGWFCIRKKGFEMKFWAMVFLAMVLISIFASSYIYSYRFGYQTQGRYLFPVLPVFGLLLYKMDARYRNRFILPIVAILFVMGVYSFVFVGINGLCF